MKYYPPCEWIILYLCNYSAMIWHIFLGNVGAVVKEYYFMIELIVKLNQRNGGVIDKGTLAKLFDGAV